MKLRIRKRFKNRCLSTKRHFAVSPPVTSQLFIPQYRNDTELMERIRAFVTEGLDTKKTASLFGLYAGVEMFCLSRICQMEWNEIEKAYSEDMVFLLTVFGRNSTIEYSISEYLSGEGYDIDGDCGIVAEIRNDIGASLEAF